MAFLYWKLPLRKHLGLSPCGDSPGRMEYPEYSPQRTLFHTNLNTWSRMRISTIERIVFHACKIDMEGMVNPGVWNLSCQQVHRCWGPAIGEAETKTRKKPKKLFLPLGF